MPSRATILVWIQGWVRDTNRSSATIGAATTSYAYDRDTNRSSATIGTATTTYLYDRGAELISRSDSG